MLIEKLTEYYGEPNKQQRDFIDKKHLGYTAADSDKLYEYILENCPQDFGFPDISKLSKAFKTIPPSDVIKRYLCCVCSNCGTYYHYSMMYCPSCWNKGLKVTTHAIKVSDEEIPHVVRYNMEHVSTSILPSCYSCKVENKEWCKHFGVAFWKCDELQTCPCASCCVKVKRDLEKKEHKPSEIQNYIPKEAV